MKVVDNGILKMEWDADLYLANKYIGFIAACKQYGDITVVFQEGNAYTLCLQILGHITETFP